MNLRDIKKDIEYVIGAFIDDCSLFSAVNKNADDAALGVLFDDAVNLYNDLKDKVNEKVAARQDGRTVQPSERHGPESSQGVTGS